MTACMFTTIFIYKIQTLCVTFLDKYGSKHTGSHTNIQAKIVGTYEQVITDRYIYEKAQSEYIYKKAKI